MTPEGTSLGLDYESLGPDGLTSIHKAGFWEALGRTIGTFAWLEWALPRAALVHLSQRSVSPDEIEGAPSDLETRMEKALSDPLGRRIQLFERSLQENPDVDEQAWQPVLERLRELRSLPDLIAHGAWSDLPDGAGRSVPAYRDTKKQKWREPLGEAELRSIRLGTVEAFCLVFNSVTALGIQFPGTESPGVPFPGDRRAAEKSP